MAVNNNSQLITNLREPVKQYLVYDGSFRVTHIYEARANAADEDPCLLTQYQYDGASSRIVKRLESISEWDSSWDLT